MTLKKIILKNEKVTNKRAAKIICNAVKRKPTIVLGLASGKTFIGVYKRIVELYRKNKIDFSRTKIFMLDEYCGFGRKNKRSLHNFIETNLLRKINIKKENVYSLNGNAESYLDECRKYERKIEQIGGIELQVLGLGVNGHIGFNEPGSPLNSRTRKIKLKEETRKHNLIFFGSLKKMPKYALTRGILSIMNARKILLVATGKIKNNAVNCMLKEKISSKCPASVLRKHKNATILLDKNAAGK